MLGHPGKTLITVHSRRTTPPRADEGTGEREPGPSYETIMRRPLDTVSETIGERAAAELERLRAEESLRRSEERFRTLYDDNPSMYFTLSPEGTVLSVNRFGAAQLGYTADELVGRSVLDVFDPADHRIVLDQLVQCVRSPHTIFAWELQKVRKDRTRLWVRERARAVPDVEGTLIILVVCEDVTERRRAAEERERLSQDLHDNILQSLYAVGMQLEAGRLSLSRTPRKAKAHTTQAIDQLNDLVGEIRQFIALLTQQTAAKPDFGQALQQLVGNFSAAGQAAPELDINDRVIAMVTAEQAEQLLNIAREALSNSMRHAQAAHRWVRLSRSDRAVRLQIRDDGVGFDPRRKRKRGHGLVNMAARAEKIGARFSLASAPDGGTCITVELPREEET